MKQIAGFLILSCFFFSSCTKVDQISTKEDQLSLPEDNGCIQRSTIPVTAHSITGTDLIIANNLFSQNNIATTNFRFFRYTQDSLQTQFPPYAKLDIKLVRLDQYTNGTRVLNGDMVFQFKNNIFSFHSDNRTAGTSLNTTPQLTLGQLRKLFIASAKKFDNVGDLYKNSCLDAEFGYYNINAGISYAPELLIKAWKVKTGPSLFDYPEAYYKDDDGTLIYYFNGIAFFK